MVQLSLQLFVLLQQRLPVASSQQQIVLLLAQLGAQRLDVAAIETGRQRHSYNLYNPAVRFYNRSETATLSAITSAFIYDVGGMRQLVPISRAEVTMLAQSSREQNSYAWLFKGEYPRPSRTGGRGC